MILFTTAGILLEDLRMNAHHALMKFAHVDSPPPTCSLLVLETRYRCVIVDECHERSSESDLILSLIKTFMVAHPREQYFHTQRADMLAHEAACFRAIHVHQLCMVA